jgi:hypothetical protein
VLLSVIAYSVQFCSVAVHFEATVEDATSPQRATRRRTSRFSLPVSRRVTLPSHVPKSHNSDLVSRMWTSYDPICGICPRRGDFYSVEILLFGIFPRSYLCDSSFRRSEIHRIRMPSVMNLTLPADLIWTVAVTPLEEQLPQPTKAPPQPIAILKCADSPARASQLSISSP